MHSIVANGKVVNLSGDRLDDYPVTRQILVDIAEASRAPMTANMTMFLIRLHNRGLAGTVTDDEFDAFDHLLDDMESL